MWQPLLPVTGKKTVLCKNIYVTRQAESNYVCGRSLKHRSRLRAGPAIRSPYDNGTIIAPDVTVFVKSRINVVIEFACRIIGDVKQGLCRASLVLATKRSNPGACKAATKQSPA
ncbi:hypothetical protein AA21952_1828 [Acetobacter oeni LMG 21952]|nr:hypothetical protein AA21952_1828 [Acetobacter oeni LMG 21952]